MSLLHKLTCATALAAVLLLVACPAGFGGTPVVREEATGPVVETTHFRAAFDVSKGGLLDKLTDSTGRTLVSGCRTYTDQGFDVARRPVSSGFEKSPKVQVERSAASVSIACEGVLRREDGQQAQAGPIRYSAQYEFGDTPMLKVTLAVALGFEQPEASGFLAHMMTLGDHVEWFAHTADGRICERAATTSQRTWQSALEPLSPEAPWLGVLLRTAQVLRVSRLRANPPLQNVFFHDSGKGPTTLFLAWLDAKGTVAMRPNERCEASFVLELLALSDLKQ
jgi:hypothetical protein